MFRGPYPRFDPGRQTILFKNYFHSIKLHQSIIIYQNYLLHFQNCLHSLDICNWISDHNWVETKLVPPLDKIFTLQCAFLVVSKQKCCFLMPWEMHLLREKPWRLLFMRLPNLKMNEDRERGKMSTCTTYLLTEYFSWKFFLINLYLKISYTSWIKIYLVRL